MLKGDSDVAAGFRCGEILRNGSSEYVGLLDNAEGLEEKRKERKTNKTQSGYVNDKYCKGNTFIS